MFTTTLPKPVRQRIDRHLDALDDVLRVHGEARVRRREIAENVETHFVEMLAERCGAREPTAEDADAVIAGMDPPRAYLGPGTAAPPAVSAPHLSVMAVIAFVLAVIGTLIFLAWVMVQLAARQRHPGTVMAISLFPMVVTLGPTAALGTLLGWRAWDRIGRAGGQLRGRPLALMAGLLWPLSMMAAAGLGFLQF
jgi:hypothetical protein